VSAPKDLQGEAAEVVVAAYHGIGLDPAVITAAIEHGNWMRPRKVAAPTPAPRTFLCGCTELVPCSLHAVVSFYAERAQ